MTKSFITLITVTLIFLLVFSFHPQVVFADGETPTSDETNPVEETPPPEEITEGTEPIDESDQGEIVDPIGSEEATPDEESVVEESELVSTPEAAEANLESTISPEETVEALDEGVEVTEQPDILEGTGTPSVSEVLAQAPEGTQVIVLDNEGQAEPLASQEAANIVSAGDPMWCPSGALPGDATCSGSYTSFDALLVDLGTFAGDGTIYVVDTYDSSLEPDDITIDGAVFTNLGALTIQGGWDGVLGGANIVGTSTFGVSLEITNWGGAVTLNDVIFDSTDYGLAITTSGSVDLNNVQVTNTGSNNGISVEAGGDVSLNNVQSSSNTENGIDITTTSMLTLNGVIASNNGSTGAVLESTADVSVTNSTFNNNSGSLYAAGLEIDSPGAVTISNVTASSNQDDGISINNSPEVYLENITVDNNGWDGVYVDGQCTNVYITNGNYTNNGFTTSGYGLEADNSLVSQSGSPIFSNNFLGDISQNLDPCFINGSPPSKAESLTSVGNVATIVSGQLVSIPCENPIFTLVTPKNTHVTFTNLCGYQVFVIDESQDDLINRLPIISAPYRGGVTITLLQNNVEISTLPESANMVLSFYVSDEELDQEFAIYNWDGNQWIELEGVTKAFERSEVMTKNICTFALVIK